MPDIITILTLVLMAGLSGVLAWIYAIKLTDPGMIFSWLYDKLSILPDWLYKPLIGCGYCVSGQIALWTYFFIDDYSLVRHAWYIGLTIFTYHLISQKNEGN